MIETLKDFLWPIVAIGGVGAFIDFLIGKAGQERAKDFLLQWWVRFDNVHWKNFGREEGLFAGKFLEQWFGRRIWSTRRIASALAVYCLLLLFAVLRNFVISKPVIQCDLCKTQSYFWKSYIGAIFMLESFLGFFISMSFTRFVTFRLAYICGVGSVRNLMIFLGMLLVNYLMLTYWLPIMQVVKGSSSGLLNSIMLVIPGLVSGTIEFGKIPILIHSVGYNFLNFVVTHLNTMFEMFDNFYSKDLMSIFTSQTRFLNIDVFANFFLPQFPTLMRFAMSIVFVASFLLGPLVMRPVNLVWARIIESEKPVFTLIFGGAAAFATAISEAAKHL